MPQTAPQFITDLTSAVPEAAPTVREHLADQEGELLLQILTADLRRLALDWFRQGRTDALQRLLVVLEAALRDGDDYVRNAIAVSFVEDLGWWEPEMQAFSARLPGELANEVKRQRHATE